MKGTGSKRTITDGGNTYARKVFKGLSDHVPTWRHTEALKSYLFREGMFVGVKIPKVKGSPC